MISLATAYLCLVFLELAVVDVLGNVDVILVGFLIQPLSPASAPPPRGMDSVIPTFHSAFDPSWNHGTTNGTGSYHPRCKNSGCVSSRLLGGGVSGSRGCRKRPHLFYSYGLRAHRAGVCHIRVRSSSLVDLLPSSLMDLYPVSSLGHAKHTS